MKPTPKIDFPVSVRRQEWEESPPAAAFYAGIFDVTLNHSVTIMFVPEIDSSVQLQVLPEDLSALTSSLQARIATLALARYAVTPDVVRHGQEEEFARVWSEGEPGLVFYVDIEEFQELCDELAILAAERPAVHNYWLMSEIKHTRLSQFILTRFLISEHVDKWHKEILGR